MLVTTASVVADRGRLDEDFVGAVPGAAVVVDGAFLPGAEGVCRHGVAWYARRLGGTLLSELGHGDDRGLAALLASAIERVTDEHRPTGDTAHPWSPWAAVAAVRVQAGRVGSSTSCWATRPCCSSASTARRWRPPTAARWTSASRTCGPGRGP